MSLLALHSLSEFGRPTPPPRVYHRVDIECGRLIHAALVSRRFCDLLLADPGKAIEAGYYDERFAFSRFEKDQITAIRAGSLEEFASQLNHLSEICKTPELAVKIEAT
jgi:hypothetical protein